jgi:VanZ family protein
MKKLFQKYIITKWPAIIWSVIIFILLAMPPVTIPNEKKLDLYQFDKVIHASLFGLLVVLIGFYLRPKYKSVSKFLLILSGIVILATLYGISMEYVQLYIGRDFDVKDMMADAVGAVLGWLFFAIKDKPR